MARINNLTDFLTDVSTAIKQKTGDTAPIPASEFDTKILKIETKGNYQEKEIEITEDGNITLLPDTGYDAISKVHISVDTPDAVLTDAEYRKAIDTTRLILTGTTETLEYVQDGLVSFINLDNGFVDEKGAITITNNNVILDYDSNLARNVARNSVNSARLLLSTPSITLTSFTLSIRAKSTGANTGEHNMMFGVYGSGTNTSFGLKSHYGKYSIERYLNSIDSTYDVNTDNDWHRYTATVENNDTLKMYVDDKLVFEQVGTYNITNGTWVIGNYILSYNMPWLGQYYGALLYDRALTEEEVKYNVTVDKGGVV